jgi:hypothetical protein
MPDLQVLNDPAKVLGVSDEALSGSSLMNKLLRHEDGSEEATRR